MSADPSPTGYSTGHVASSCVVPLRKPRWRKVTIACCSCVTQSGGYLWKIRTTNPYFTDDYTTKTLELFLDELYNRFKSSWCFFKITKELDFFLLYTSFIFLYVYYIYVTVFHHMIEVHAIGSWSEALTKWDGDNSITTPCHHGCICAAAEVLMSTFLATTYMCQPARG